MTDDVAQFPLTAQAQVPRHVLGPAVLVPAATHGEQHEKTCTRCGAVRVTVIARNGWIGRMWRPEGEGYTTFEPPCPPYGVAS